MAKLLFFTATPLNIGQVLLKWQFDETPLVLDLFKSFEHEDEEEVRHLVNLPRDQERFIDFDDSTSITVNRFYKIRTRFASTPEGHYEFFGPAEIVKIHPEAKAMLRKNSVVLPKFKKIGAPSLLFVRRKAGEECTRCYNPVLERREVSDCEECSGTGIIGGYHKPIELTLFDSQTLKMHRMNPEGIERQTIQADFWTSGVPLIESQDVLVNKFKNARYRVSAVQRVEHRNFPVAQLLQVSYLNPNEIEYRLGQA